MSPMREEVWIIDDEERRIAPRTEVHGWVVSNPVAGEVVNLSETGMALATSHGLRVGESMRLSVNDGFATRSMRGSVRWCRLVRVERGSENQLRPRYLSGIAFSV